MHEPLSSGCAFEPECKEKKLVSPANSRLSESDVGPPVCTPCGAEGIIPLRLCGVAEELTQLQMVWPIRDSTAIEPWDNHTVTM